MAIETKLFDAAKYFQADKEQIDLINSALASHHAGYIAAAIGTIAKARDVSDVARDVGLSRQGLHAALTETLNPSIETVAKVLDTLGLRLEVVARESARA